MNEKVELVIYTAVIVIVGCLGALSVIRLFQ
jgi:hypothetical protein